VGSAQGSLLGIRKTLCMSWLEVPDMIQSRYALAVPSSPLLDISHNHSPDCVIQLCYRDRTDQNSPRTACKGVVWSAIIIIMDLMHYDYSDLYDDSCCYFQRLA